jgi:peroxin-3
MNNPLTNYFYERRRGLAKTAGIAGGVYVLSGYIKQRLEEMRDHMVEDRAAREK